MPRYKCTVEYDGRPYHGWQSQPGVPTVQDAIEEAIRPLNKGELLRTQVSGRTDAGVHALGQVCHFDLEKDYDANAVMMAVNHYLKPQPIALVKVEKVTEEFHARFSSKARSYMYRLVNRRTPMALDQGRAWGYFKELDVEAMNEAAQLLLGTHDFSTFRDSECQAKSPIKTMDRLVVLREGGPQEIRFYTKSRSFLHHQVRNMVGSLTLVGKGAWSLDDFQRALEARDRRAGGPTAPADGLYFVEVDY
jgi:tRNA pseudouridine38-40 synthase